MTAEKRMSGRVDRHPVPENPESITKFSDRLSVTTHRFHDGGIKIFQGSADPGADR